MEANFLEIFRIGDYNIPKYIDGIDIQYNRENDLKKLDSSFSRKFRQESLKSLINSSNLPRYTWQYIREFPIIILDIIKWKKILLDFKLSNNKEYYHRKFFKLDYLFPYTGIAVEIDSEYHNKIYDAARDLYLKESFGITTIRYFKDNTSDLSNLSKLSEYIINNKVNPEIKIALDFSNKINFSGIFDIIIKDIELEYRNYYCNNIIVISRNIFINK